jgi:hypothetical protein
MHQITTSVCSTSLLGPVAAGLSVAYLDINHFNFPNVFFQGTDGVWNGPQSLNFPGSLASIVGLPNILIALTQGGLLYVATFNTPQGEAPQATNWSGFQPVTMPAPPGITNAPFQFNDFSATIAIANNAYVLVIVAVQNSNGQNPDTGGATDAGYYAFTVNISDLQSLSGPVSGSWTSISQSSTGLIGGANCPALVATNQGVALVGIAGNSNAGLWNGVFQGFFSSDLSSWTVTLFDIFNPFGEALIGLGPTNVTLIAGNPDGTLQAIIPINGQLVLFYSSTGQEFSQWVRYGSLFSVPDMVQQFFAAAAGFQAPGTPPENLQVVGLSFQDVLPGNPPVALPFLVWQDTSGAWSPYNNGFSLQSDFAALNVQPLDLATGMGFGYGTGGLTFLQVVYLGSDGNVYLNYQDQNGNWGWYAGAGQGLP